MNKWGAQLPWGRARGGTAALPSITPLFILPAAPLHPKPGTFGGGGGERKPLQTPSWHLPR